MADQIRFTGETIQAKRYEIGLDDQAPAWPWLTGVAAIALIAIPLIRKVSRR